MTENGAMKVEKIKPVMTEYIKPLTHIELFTHCANGLTMVSVGTFKKTIRPLLHAHGINEIRVV